MHSLLEVETADRGKNLLKLIYFSLTVQKLFPGFRQYQARFNRHYVSRYVSWSVNTPIKQSNFKMAISVRITVEFLILKGYTGVIMSTSSYIKPFKKDN